MGVFSTPLYPVEDAKKSSHKFQSVRDSRSLRSTNGDWGAVPSLVSGSLKNVKSKNRLHAVAKSGRKIAL
jgi:hypothetical protein